MAAQASKKSYLGAVKTYGGGALIRGGHRSSDHREHDKLQKLEQS